MNKVIKIEDETVYVGKGDNGQFTAISRKVLVLNHKQVITQNFIKTVMSILFQKQITHLQLALANIQME